LDENSDIPLDKNPGIGKYYKLYLVFTFISSMQTSKHLHPSLMFLGDTRSLPCISNNKIF
jgi:hypothetical protein